MKPRDYLKTLGPKLESAKVKDSFFQHLLDDFEVLLQTNHGEDDATRFEHCLNMLRTKWECIGFKRGKTLPETNWDELLNTINDRRRNLFGESVEA